MSMSFPVEICYEFSKNLEGLLDPTIDTTIVAIKDEEGTVATEATSEQSVAQIIDQKAATQIQAVARGRIVRNKAMKQSEQKAVMDTRTKAGQTIMNEEEEGKESIEDNIRSVRELLKKKQATWERCQKGRIGEKDGSTQTFIRTGFMTVHTKTENRKVQFTSRAEKSEKSYDMQALEVLPGKLEGIFEVHYDEFGFVNYEGFLEKSLLLHERVLQPFLLKLKGHLERVNVLLAEIDAWLAEPQADLAFLKKIFGLDEKLTITTETTTLKECELEDDFQVNGSFNIQTSRDQKMLGKLLVFISE
ncbi:unnamed protein product [Cylindrotheca closterium]|uniref:Uncharacterized protein n=1 Tax=Cylindrotheca closterium TaxID=2856 RepID=A0AAD2FTQ5_9STRA|nr:unnamed protein product [Cylindrotheca closterium]